MKLLSVSRSLGSAFRKSGVRTARERSVGCDLVVVVVVGVDHVSSSVERGGSQVVSKCDWAFSAV